MTKNEVVMNRITERDYLWDNIKAVLIFLVVAGHALELSALKTNLSVYVDMFIYSFHMPAFLFVSGYFLKRYCVNGKVRAEKAAVIFAYYMVFQLLFTLLREILIHHITRINLFNPNRGLWYLLALFFYYLLIPLIEKLPAWFVLPLSVVLAIFISNNRDASVYFTILRAAMFAPFCFAGYYFSEDCLKKLRSLKAYIRFPAAICCICASISLWFFRRSELPWMKLFYCKENNLELKIDFNLAILYRLEVYLIAFLMIAALLLIMPTNKTIFSKIGKNSLPVFVFHMALVVALFDSKIIILKIDQDWIFALEMLVSLAVTIILSFNIFTYPFKWIQMGVNKLYSVKKTKT